MIKPVEIYREVESKIQNINTNIEVPANTNELITQAFNNYSIRIHNELLILQANIKELENSSEWEHYTISFIGETNAGKSTIIESLRIKFEEKKKHEDHQYNTALEKEKKTIENFLNEERVKFDTERENILIKKNSDLDIYLQKVEDAKSTFMYKFRIVFQKNFKPYNTEILTLKSEIEVEQEKVFENLDFITSRLNRLKSIEAEMRYDGEIIGDGRLDFTQTNNYFFIQVGKELVKIIDVPGIEGNEQKYEEEIRNAVRGSHSVFYVTSALKPLEEGTLKKVKKYIKDQAEVCAIVNFRHLRYKQEYVSQTFEKIYENSLEKVESISKQFSTELKENYVKTIALNAHWGFLGLSQYLRDPKLQRDKIKLNEVFKTSETIIEKSNFNTLDDIILELVQQKENKIHRVNILKINTRLASLIGNLQDIHGLYFNESHLNNMRDEIDNAKRMLRSYHNDFKNELDKIRKRGLSLHKQNISTKIHEFVDKSDFDRELYVKNLEQILKEQNIVLNDTLSKEILAATKTLQKNISKAIEKLLDRVNQLSKTHNFRLVNESIALDIHFDMNDYKKIGSQLLNLLGWVTTGASLGSVIPVIGNIVGGVIGAVLGISIEVFKNLFLSAKSKKSKFLDKLDETLDKKHQENNHLLMDNFNNVAKETEEILIAKNVQLIEEIFDLYQVRSNQLMNVISELKAIQVNL